MPGESNLALDARIFSLDVDESGLSQAFLASFAWFAQQCMTMRGWFTQAARIASMNRQNVCTAPIVSEF
jgi:predicted anti-sigma-YlaC factor YlaD